MNSENELVPPHMRDLLRDDARVITVKKASAENMTTCVMEGVVLDRPTSVIDEMWTQSDNRMAHLKPGESIEWIPAPMITIRCTDHFSSGMARVDGIITIFCVHMGRKCGDKPCTSLPRSVMRAMERGEHRAIQAGRLALGKLGKLGGWHDLVPSEFYIDRSGARREYL